MSSYKEKYLKYKTKYLNLRNKMIGGFSPNEELTSEERKILLDNIGVEFYATILNLIEAGKLFVSVLKIYISNYKEGFNKETFRKYITLVLNNIDIIYADILSKKINTTEEILKYKQIPHNFISEILDFTKEQKDRLENLLSSTIPSSLSFYLVKNKTIEEQTQIIKDLQEGEITLSDALKLVQKKN